MPAAGDGSMDLGGQLETLARELQKCRESWGQLRLREERYALALQGSGDGLWDWDLAAERVHLCARFRALVHEEEAAAEEPLRAWFDRLHPEDLVALQADLAAHLEGRTPTFENEHRVLRKDGSDRWVLARGVAVLDGEGRPRRLAGTLSDVTARKKAEELLLYQAVHDVLTGLPNRAAFLERLERSVARCRFNPDYRFAVFFLDLDRFKLVNDSLGHLSGDQLLVAVARRLVGCLRPGDMVAHAGGDEFTLLVDHIDAPLDASYVARRVQKSLSTPFDLGGQEVFVSASMGIALSGSHARPHEMLRDADTAMYRAKSRGAGGYELFDREMQAQSLSRLQLETDLRRALDREEFRLHYQPIVSLRTGLITGFEALLRWQHPERGLLFPGAFLSVAEETGLILGISEWVMRLCCAQVLEWKGRHPQEPPLTMSMNMTSQSFTRSDVERLVSETLARSGLDGRHLQLEITESVFMEDLDAVVAVLVALKGREVEFHIDDFGTGYSSLSYLHRLPTEVLKIDRSFVGRMGQAGDDGVIVRTIVELAHNLGRRVIAEGVETAEQLARLRALGCEHAQGFFFARALPSAEAEALLLSRPRW
ncbi:MAG TPA: EAL domain-containing protein [Vicinamibacteria bacterium]|nr:EAL domain-containing protein [Vicinamibacteria bacterium]